MLQGVDVSGGLSLGYNLFIMLRLFRNYSKVVSSVPEGTILKGCNVRKNGQDPVALKDEEYPEWLWEVLDPEIQAQKLAADPIKAARKQRREENRRKIKEHNFLKAMDK